MSWRRFLVEPSWSRLDVYGFTGYVIFTNWWVHSASYPRASGWERFGVGILSLLALVCVVQVLTWLVDRGR